jgi:ferredoxin
MKLGFNPLVSLAQAAMALAESERIDVSLAPDRCLHQLDKSSECARCVNACPTDAITFEESKEMRLVTHDGGTCVKCGLCLRVCPVEAFTGDNGVATLLSFIARQEKRAIVEVACALHPHKEQGPPQANVVVNSGACLAALGPSAILALMAIGVAHVILRVDFCQSCPLAQSRAEIDKTADQVASLLRTDSGLGPPVTLLDTVRDDWPNRLVAAVKAPPRSRRDFFRAFAAPDEVPEDVQHLMLVGPTEEEKRPPSERLRRKRSAHRASACAFLERQRPYLKRCWRPSRWRCSKAQRSRSMTPVRPVASAAASARQGHCASRPMTKINTSSRSLAAPAPIAVFVAICANRARCRKPARPIWRIGWPENQSFCEPANSGGARNAASGLIADQRLTPGQRLTQGQGLTFARFVISDGGIHLAAGYQKDSGSRKRHPKEMTFVTRDAVLQGVLLL